MTNEEMLLRALNGEELPENLTFHPQNNKQAYLAYAVGLLTDPSALPEPYTIEEALMKEVAINGGTSTGGEGGVTLPTLTNPALAAYILATYDAINQNGARIVGTMTDNGAMEMELNADTPAAYIPKGFHDGAGRVRIHLEEKTVTPSEEQQEIIPSAGKVLSKVIVEPAPAGGDGGGADDFVITDGRYLFHYGARVADIDTYLSRCKGLTNMAHMFDGGTLVTEQTTYIEDPEVWAKIFALDTSEVTDMQYAFYYNPYKLYKIDISGWDTSKVNNMKYMFASCRNATEINIGDSFGGMQTSMERAFYDCQNIKTLDTSGWRTGNVVTMNALFRDCKALRSIDFTPLDTSMCSNMGDLFVNCSKLEEVTGFSAMSRAGISISFPTGSSYTPAMLRRLTIRTDLPEGQYSLRSAINIKYCSFSRESMVEFFNSLPDVSALGLSTSYRTITITGNPCVTGTYEAKAGSESGPTDLCELIRNKFLHRSPVTATVNGVTDIKTGEDWLNTYGDTGVEATSISWNSGSVTGIETLTDEDKAIATSKGWLLTT